MEDIDHLFHSSEVAMRVQSHFASLFGARIYNNSNNWRSLLTTWMVQFQGSSQVQLLALLTLAVISWEIWIARNNAKYNDDTIYVDHICGKVQRYFAELNSLVRPSKTNPPGLRESLHWLGILEASLLVRTPLLVRWFPPKNETLKLNIDGSSLGNPGNARFGGAFKFIFGFSHCIGVATNSMAEAFALKLGLYYCYLRGVNRVWMEIDSQLVEHWFNGRGTPPWSLYNIWGEIMDLAEYLDLNLSHVYCETNTVEMSGANGCSQFVTYIKDFPKATIGCIVLDASGIPTFRFH